MNNYSNNRGKNSSGRGGGKPNNAFTGGKWSGNSGSGQVQYGEKDINFTSPNMSYIYNAEYYDRIINKKISASVLNDKITDFRFKASFGFEIPDEDQTFRMKTIYPGLVIGTGNLHSYSATEALKLGFQFDYTTGLPYIPGSSLKGILRSVFPDREKKDELSKGREEYIKSVLDDIGAVNVSVYDLKDNIFENNDVFVGAFPVVSGKTPKILAMDYMTNHNGHMEPNPVSFLKVRPGVTFMFSFLLSDFVTGGTVAVSREMKMKLFEQVIEDFGAGAKTNTGYGGFERVDE